MNNRRSCTRWQINWQAQLKLEGAECFTKCLINDINLKGLGIHCSQQLPADAFRVITIILNPEYKLEQVEAWVAWQKKIGPGNAYGLYFTKIKESQKDIIYQFIKAHFAQQLYRHWWSAPLPRPNLAVKADAPEPLHISHQPRDAVARLGSRKGGDAMEDKRIFERFSAELPLRYLNLKENKEGQALTYDISAKGVCVMAQEPIKPHTPMEMWLDMPDKGEPLYTRGEVVWSRSQGLDEYRIGINLEKADLMGLSRVIRTL